MLTFQNVRVVATTTKVDKVPPMPAPGPEFLSQLRISSLQNQIFPRRG